MKKLLAVALVLVLCLSVVLVACDKKGGGGTTDSNNPVAKLDAAADAVYKFNKDSIPAETTGSFDLSKSVPLEGIYSFPVEWTVNTDKIQIVDKGNGTQVTVKIPERSPEEIVYTLTATVKADDGSTKSVTFERKVPKFVVATYDEYIAACKANDKNKTYNIVGYVVAVNAAPLSSSKGSLWVMDKDGHGYYAYAPALDASITATRESINAEFPIGTEVVVTGSLTLYSGAYEFNKGCTVTKTGRTAAQDNVTLDYVDRTEAFAAAKTNKDESLVPYQATLIELKGVTLGAKSGKNYYFTLGDVTDFVCYNDIYLMDDETSAAFAEKWVEGAKANIKGVVNTFSSVYQVYPQGLDALEILPQTDAEKVAGVKGALKLEESYEENFTLPTSKLVDLTWAVSGTGAVIGENNLVTVTRANADQKVVFTATLKSGEVTDTVTFNVTIPAIVIDDPNTVIINSKNLKIANSYVDGEVTFDGVTISFKQLSDYGDGIQMRQKNDVYSSLWNTTAFERAIASITLKLSSSKSVFDNANAFAIKFGNAADNLTETISFSTVKDQLEYTITPEGKDWTFMSFTKTIKDYTFYFESITINYALSDADAVVADKDALKLEESYHSAFDLPLKGANGTTIAWATKTETTVVAIDAAGHVTINPVDPSTAITLVATISKGEAKATREFPITILKETPKYVISWTAGEHGTITSAKVGEADATSGAEFEDGTVITFVLAPEAGYIAKYAIGEGAAVAVKDNTFTVTADEAKTIAITFVEQYAAKTIAEYKALTKETAGTEGYKLTGVVTSIDKKAAYIQDATGAAVYVFFGYTAPYSNTLKTLQIGKEYTICGYYDNYSGLVQLKTPVLIGEAKDPETAIVAKDLDEAAYKALTIGNSAELVNLKGLKVAGGKFMLGETAIAYYTGNVADANKADLEAMVAFLKDGVNFDLVNVNVCVNKNAVQIEIVRASSIVIDWAPVAEIDVAEIGINDIAQITVTASPAVATDIKATFVSDHPEIAKVDENGKVTGVAAGDAIITVTANGKTTTVAVKVVAVVEKFAVNFTKTGTNGNITTVTVDGTEINPGDEVVKGKTIVVTVAPAEGYRLASVTIGEGAADTSFAGKTSFELTITADTTFAVAFEEIPATKTLQKATSIAVGDQIVLAYESDSKKYEMGTYANGFFNIAAYTDVPAQAQLLTVVSGAAEGQFAFKTASGKYLTLTTDGNKLFESELSAVNDAASWTVTFDANGNIVITSVKYTNRCIQFNANSGQERFATYKGSQQSIIAYKLV
mgnify:FL=1